MFYFSCFMQLIILPNTPLIVMCQFILSIISLHNETDNVTSLSFSFSFFSNCGFKFRLNCETTTFRYTVRTTDFLLTPKYGQRRCLTKTRGNLLAGIETCARDTVFTIRVRAVRPRASLFFVHPPT